MENKEKELNERIALRNQEIKHLKLKVKELEDEISYVKSLDYKLNKGDYIFVETLTHYGKVRTYGGYVEIEGAKFLKIKIHNRKSENVYFYIIAKSTISGIKVYENGN